MKYFLRIAFQTVLLFLFSITVESHDSRSWLLKATHTEFLDGKPENVTLTCRYDNDNENDNDNDDDNNTQPMMKEVNRILILKFDNDPHKPWMTYAKVNDANRPAVLVHHGGDGVTVHGLAGQVDQSYLSVTWMTATQFPVGTYMCEVHGYADDLDTHTMSNTKTITLGMPAMEWEAVLASYFKFEEWSETLHGYSIALQRQSDALHRKSKAVHSNSISLLKYSANHLCDKFTSCPTKTKAPSPTEWPEGNFALLSPGPDGCRSPFKGGFVRFHTESSRGDGPNGDSVSKNSHLNTPNIRREDGGNVFYMKTCRREYDRRTRAPAWPNGTYCILQGGDVLPDGFKPGYIYLDMENDAPPLSELENIPGMTIDSNGNVWLDFACREDGHQSYPIELPVKNPFFLFRRGGRCQEVLNAKVTEESFTLDTEDNTNGDYVYEKWKPDVTLNPVRFQVCYYEQMR